MPRCPRADQGKISKQVRHGCAAPRLEVGARLLPGLRGQLRHKHLAPHAEPRKAVHAGKLLHSCIVEGRVVAAHQARDR
eukprot:6585858-Alexandrium_andersonii.AAC.1